MTTRRELVIVGAASLGALVKPLISFAQQPGKIWRVGFLSTGVRPVSASDTTTYGAFLSGMRGLGYIEGKNLRLEERFADNNAERLSGLAAELVKLRVDVILAAGVQATSAAQKATTSIPIVMGSSIDPVGSGLVASLRRPGGNTTGLSNLSGDLGPKQLELLSRMVPKLSRVAVLLNPGNLGHATILKAIQTAAQKSHITILPVEAQTPEDLESAFSKMVQQNAQAVIVVQGPLFVRQGGRPIVELAAKYRLPSITGQRIHAESGGLMSYGTLLANDYRRAATYVDKIFKGTKPGDLPIEQPTKFELIINSKTAKALGLAIPQSLLISADLVIE